MLPCSAAHGPCAIASPFSKIATSEVWCCLRTIRCAFLWYEQRVGSKISRVAACSTADCAGTRAGYWVSPSLVACRPLGQVATTPYSTAEPSAGSLHRAHPTALWDFKSTQRKTFQEHKFECGPNTLVSASASLGLQSQAALATLPGCLSLRPLKSFCASRGFWVFQHFRRLRSCWVCASIAVALASGPLGRGLLLSAVHVHWGSLALVSLSRVVRPRGKEREQRLLELCCFASLGTLTYGKHSMLEKTAHGNTHEHLKQRSLRAPSPTPSS